MNYKEKGHGTLDDPGAEGRGEQEPWVSLAQPFCRALEFSANKIFFSTMTSLQRLIALPSQEPNFKLKKVSMCASTEAPLRNLRIYAYGILFLEAISSGPEGIVKDSSL